MSQSAPLSYFGSRDAFVEARRCMANCKLVEFRRQCWRLSGLVRGIAGKQATVDLLWELAIAHALVRALGEERVQAIIAEAFAGHGLSDDSQPGLGGQP
jgi:hypothetical protein